MVSEASAFREALTTVPEREEVNPETVSWRVTAELPEISIKVADNVADPTSGMMLMLVRMNVPSEIEKR